MTSPTGTPTGTPESHGDELSRETRESAALVLVVMAVVVTISFVGLAIS
ncbi:MAG: hypothetical protein ACRDMW_04680 [Gaiellaceae bacterium]